MAEQSSQLVAFVTGAASGIGAAIAEEFAKAGYIVGGADIKPFSPAVATIEPLILDVADELQWQLVLGEFAERHGRLDVLVNVAGILDTGAIVELAPDRLMQLMSVNANSVFAGCRIAIPIMAKAGVPCSIVNIASANAVKAQSWTSAYAATKAAVVSLTRTTALHCAELGYAIRVNAVLPGIVETPMVRSLIEGSDSPETTRRNLEAHHPIGRLLQPSEIATVSLFLSSAGASGMTGASIAVDGGMTAG